MRIMKIAVNGYKGYKIYEFETLHLPGSVKLLMQ